MSDLMSITKPILNKFGGEKKQSKVTKTPNPRLFCERLDLIGDQSTCDNKHSLWKIHSFQSLQHPLLALILSCSLKNSPFLVTMYFPSSGLAIIKLIKDNITITAGNIYSILSVN